MYTIGPYNPGGMNGGFDFMRDAALMQIGLSLGQLADSARRTEEERMLERARRRAIEDTAFLRRPRYYDAFGDIDPTLGF